MIRFGPVAGLVMALAACSPAPIRTDEGLLVSEGQRPLTTDAVEVRGQLRWEGSCLILERPGAGTFQPVFVHVASRTEFERQLGNRSYPVEVAVYGFDARTPEKQGVGSSIVARQCPGTPFYFGRIIARSNVPEPPKPEIP